MELPMWGEISMIRGAFHIRGLAQESRAVSEVLATHRLARTFVFPGAFDLGFNTKECS